MKKTAKIDEVKKVEEKKDNVKNKPLVKYADDPTQKERNRDLIGELIERAGIKKIQEIKVEEITPIKIV